MRYYYMAFIPARSGGYVILSPDFREIRSQGASLEECMGMSMDALEIIAKEYAQRQEPMPDPCDSIEARARIREVLESVDEPREECIFQLVPAPEASLSPVRVSTTFPKRTLDIIDRKARELGMSRSGFLAAAAEAY